MERAYDIFRKDRPDHEPVWVETVQGLEEAKKRLRVLASKSPGEYMLWDSVNNKFIKVEPA